MPDNPTLTPAYCARRAAETLDLVEKAGDAGCASVLVAAARAWMDLGDLIRAHPGAWRASGGAS